MKKRFSIREYLNESTAKSRVPLKVRSTSVLAKVSKLLS